MRIIHKQTFSAQEVEAFRQQIYKNIINGMHLILEALPTMDLLLQECNAVSTNACNISIYGAQMGIYI